MECHCYSEHDMYLFVGVSDDTLAKMVLALTNKIQNAFNASFSQDSLFIEVNDPVVVVQSVDLKRFSF